jgi:hypothetical protein
MPVSILLFPIVQTHEKLPELVLVFGDRLNDRHTPIALKIIFSFYLEQLFPFTVKKDQISIED